MERRSSLALFAARAAALALAIGITTWLVLGAQRRADRSDADPAAPTALDGALHGSKSMVLDATEVTTTSEPDGHLFSSKSAVVSLPGFEATTTADPAPAAPKTDVYLPSSKVLRLSPQPPVSENTKPGENTKPKQ